MNPEIFLEQSDIVPLVLALNRFFFKVSNAGERQNILEVAGIDISSLSSLNFNTPSSSFSQALVASFRSYRSSSSNVEYHPLIKFLKYLSELAILYHLPEQDITLFNRLIEHGQENLKALVCRNAVGRIESPKANGIGTGILIGKGVLLTCEHIFTKTQVQQAWVRFWLYVS